MGTINKLKYKQAILFFANRIPANELGRKKLYKLLYFLDFNYFHEHGQSLTGETYRKLEMGPAPCHYLAIVREMEAEGAAEECTLPTATGYSDRKSIRALKHYDLSDFTTREKEALKEVVRKYGKLDGNKLGELSHQDPPWIMAEEKGTVSYDDTWYRYNPELDDDTDPITEVLSKINLAQLVEDKFGKGEE
jgi:uncharacterized phage-associated protein